MRKRIFSLLLALVMALGLTVTAAADEPTTEIKYLDWDGTHKKLVETQLDASITPTEITESNRPTTWNAGWYVVSGDVTIDANVQVIGIVNLILMDGATLTVNEGITVGNSNGYANLTIWQSAGETAGKLSCTGMTIDCHGSVGGSVTLNSGTVDIGGAVSVKGNGTGTGCSLTVNGGTLNVGGGITVEANANNGTLTVSGGTLNVTNSGGDAIRIEGRYHKPGNMTITGGTVIAKSTKDGGRAINCDPNTQNDTTLGTLKLPATYWWRTVEGGDFTASTATTYTPDSEAYVEITTTEPVQPEPEPTHSHTRRQHVTAVEDTTPDTDTAKADEAKTDTVTSAKTFDTGVAVYGAMAVVSLLGMGYVGKKRV